MLKEIKYPIKEPEWNKSNTKKKCPNCNGKMRWDRIPCPNGKEGCLVLHYGYRCLECGKIFQ